MADNEESKTGNQELGLPLFAAFGLQGNFLNPRLTGHFAGGAAAYNLAAEKIDQNTSNSEICLQNMPADSRNFIARLWESEEDYHKRQRNFYFATDTSYGLKVAWSGTGGPYPDSLKLGYNRKEFASPPIFINKGCEKNVNGYSVKLAAFYASIDNDSGFYNLTEVSQPWSATIKHVQFLATGTAASEFAKREQVRQVAFQNMAPNSAVLTTKEINDDSLTAIAEVIKDDAKKQAIMKKAIELGLIEKEVTAEELLTALKGHVTTNNYFTTSKLYSLRKITQ